MIKSSGNKFQNFIIYLYFISINFDQVNLFGLGIDFLATKITITLLVLISLIDFKHFYSFKNFKKYFYPIILFFLLLTIRSYLNQSTYYPNYFELAIFFPILIFIIISNHSTTEKNIILKGLFAFSITVAIISIFEVIGVRVDVYGQGRFTVFGDNANEMGLKLCISILVLISIMYENKLQLGKWRYKLILLIPAMLKYLIDTGSRVSILSLVAGVLFYLLLFNNKFSMKKIVLVLLSFFIIFLIWNLFLQYTLIGERLIDTAQSGDISSRDIIWDKVYNFFLPNLIFGIGLPQYQELVTLLFGYFTSPHNVIIEIIVYTGIVGLSIFSVFLFRILKCAVKKYIDKLEILPIILIVPVIGMIFSGQIFGVKIAWILFAYFISKPFINSYNTPRKTEAAN